MEIQNSKTWIPDFRLVIFNPQNSLSMFTSFFRLSVPRFSLLLFLLIQPLFLLSQSPQKLTEIELTPDLVASLQPKLANPTLASQLEVLDKLVFGKGNVLRIEGKSRRCLVLMLDSGGRQFVKLFDLSSYDLNDPKLRGLFYFNGVFSKAEQTSKGVIEISVTYARLSSGPGHPYSNQAETFVRRNREFKQQNQEILSGESKSAPSRSANPQPTSLPRSTNEAKPKQAGEPVASAKKGSARESPASATTASAEETKKDASKEPAESEDSSESPKNRPILMRRNRTEKENGADNSTSAENPTATPGGIQVRADQDVVVYRKKKKGGVEDGSTRENSSPLIDSEMKPLSTVQPPREVDGMMLIPEGYVTLGSDEVGDREKPVHRVLVQTFYLDRYEVTNREYKMFCDATGHKVPPYWKNKTYPKELEKYPVVQVTWHDAIAYARWVGKRLPTEVEWERAAKGPHGYRYAYGNVYDPRKANTETRKTLPVGSYTANDFGLFDMTGNANEWTSSLFKPYPYKKADGREDIESSGTRVLRGGGNSSGTTNSRCLVRLDGLPDYGTPSDGFRCARDSN
jgi:formylglycine-generating enzyme required for sulfatase activity